MSSTSAPPPACALSRPKKAPQYRPLRQDNIFEAVKKDDGETIARLVIENGHDPNERGLKGWSEGWTPAYVAALFGRLDALQALRKAGADLNATAVFGAPLVYGAALNGHLDVVKYLHDTCGCDINVANNNGKTPVQVATEYGHLDVVKFLNKITEEDAPKTEAKVEEGDFGNDYF